MPQFEWEHLTSPLTMVDADQITRLLHRTTGERLTIDRVLMYPLEHGSAIIMRKKGEIICCLIWITSESDTARVIGFGVDPMHQSKGIGSECWSILNRSVKAAGLTRITLEVRVNNDGAIRFYKKRGLQPIGWLRGYYPDALGILMSGPVDSSKPCN
ncbi:MAG: hypothetical protein CMB13_04530 [Euryarchaeota archaeon]|nr:hypothetical protein [Euryarchaeota archaeon]